MSVDNPFDCVEMKWEIQRRIAPEYLGLTSAEVRKKIEEAIAKDPLLLKFLPLLIEAHNRIKDD